MADYVDFAGDMLSIGATTDRKWTTFDVDSYHDDGVHLDREQTLRVITELADIVDHVLPQPAPEPVTRRRFWRRSDFFIFTGAAIGGAVWQQIVGPLF